MLADTPQDWPDPPPMSTLHALLLFGGVPLAVIIVVSLLVMAPSLAKGPRYRPDQEWDAEAEQFGATPIGAGATSAGQIESGTSSPGRQQATDAVGERQSSRGHDSGGASVGW
jgi:hypothetical protein